MFKYYVSFSNSSVDLSDWFTIYLDIELLNITK